MANQAAPRVIGGRTYPDPVAYVVAGGFSALEARKVINAYKAFYARQRGKFNGSWQEWVSSDTCIDLERCVAIMQRYRWFYGK